MNNRIKWLALNAGFDLGRDWEVIGLSEDSLKTYTELIVKECMNATRGASTGLDAFNNIKEHFGVGE